jgi:hypothetical protein
MLSIPAMASTAAAFLALPAVAGAAPLDAARARAVFSEARAMTDADRGKLWNRKLEAPLLLVDHATRKAIANQSDATGALTEHDGVFVGQVPANISVSEASLDWAGMHWTVLQWPLPEQLHVRRGRVAHALLRRALPELGLPTTAAEPAHLATGDGRTWVRLEWRALRQALLTPEKSDRRSALEDDLIFRAYRRSLIPSAAAAESSAELAEGLAAYTGLKLSGLPEHVLPDRAALRIEREEVGSRIAEAFGHVSGLAYGLLLDEHASGWRRRVKTGGDLGELLRQRLQVRIPDDLEKHARVRAGRHGIAAVMARDDRRGDTRLVRGGQPAW